MKIKNTVIQKINHFLAYSPQQSFNIHVLKVVLHPDGLRAFPLPSTHFFRRVKELSESFGRCYISSLKQKQFNQVILCGDKVCRACYSHHCCLKLEDQRLEAIPKHLCHTRCVRGLWLQQNLGVAIVGPHGRGQIISKSCSLCTLGFSFIAYFVAFKTVDYTVSSMIPGGQYPGFPVFAVLPFSSYESSTHCINLCLLLNQVNVSVFCPKLY